MLKHALKIIFLCKLFRWHNYSYFKEDNKNAKYCVDCHKIWSKRPKPSVGFPFRTIKQEEVSG